MDNIFIIKITQESKDENGIYFQEDFTTITGYFTSKENAANNIKQKIEEIQADPNRNTVDYKIYDESGCARINYAHGNKQRFYTILELFPIN